jgi:HAD superfamily hydrolase (TIGR01450 family)
MSGISSIRHLALDLDGTLYLGGRLFEWTPGFLKTIRGLGIGRTFFTNNSSKSTKEYVKSLNFLGVDATAEEVYSSTHSTFDYLREELPGVKRVYVLGTPGLREEFGENGFTVVGEGHEENPDAVVVGYDTTLSYEHVCRAAWWIEKGLPFVATHPDRVCPTDKPTVMVDCAAMCAMLSVATGKKLTAVLGKPDPRMLAGVMKRNPGLKAKEIGVVGDRLYTDMAMAHGAGAMGILVLSGEATREDAMKAECTPDLIVEHVGVLGEMLKREPRAEALGLAEELSISVL